MRLAIQTDDIHLWLLRRHGDAQESAATAPGRDLLATDEIRRALTCNDLRRRQDLIASRAVLRCVLSLYLDAAPAEVPLTVERHGKVRLADGGPEPGLQFNLSHTADWWLLGCALGFPLGVDIEAVRDGRDLGGLAQRCFSASEVTRLATLPTEACREALYRTWTAKEALLKATGLGFTLSPRTFETADTATEGTSGLNLPAIVTAPGPLRLLAVHDPVWGLASDWNGLRFRVAGPAGVRPHVACIAARHPAPGFTFPQVTPDGAGGFPPADLNPGRWLSYARQRA